MMFGGERNKKSNDVAASRNRKLFLFFLKEKDFPRREIETSYEWRVIYAPLDL